MSGWTFPYASGVEVTRGAILAAIGQKPDKLTSVRNWTCAERAFISIPGKVHAVNGVRTARAAPYVKDLFFRVEPGSRVIFPENNVTKCGNVIAVAPDRQSAVSAAEDAARAVLIRLEAPDPETGAFLWPQECAVPKGGPVSAPSPANPGSVWPPSAFTPPPELAAAFTALPDISPPSGAVPENAALVPFPAFTGSACRDWMGRTVTESLDAVRELTGLPLRIEPYPCLNGDKPFLGRAFWAALIRGGYQGAVYALDLRAAGTGGES
jgi:hypothetical protein